MTAISYRSLVSLIRSLFLGTFLAAVPLYMVSFGQVDPAAESPVQRCWKYDFDGTGDVRIESDGVSAFMIRNGSVVDAVSLDSGKLAWSSDLGGNIESNLLINGGNLILVRRSVTDGSKKNDQSEVMAISAATGITKWSSALPNGATYNLGLAGEKVLAFSTDGFIHFLSASDGVESRSLKTNDSIQVAIFDSDRTFFVTGEKEIKSVIAAGGELTVVARHSYPISAFKSGADGSLIWGDEHGNITSFLTSSNRPEWRFKSGAKINEIVRVNGYLLASSNDNFVYAISPGSGTRIWKKRFGGRIQSLVPIGNDAVLVQTLGESKLVVLNAKNGKTSNQISFDGTDEIPLGSRATNLGSILMLTNEALYRYSRNNCTANTQSGPL